MTAESLLLESAKSMVGSSKNNPLAMIKSADANTDATEGAGSKVCEFAPSGTIPSKLILAPPMFSTKLVIGETVVTTVSFLVLAVSVGVKDWFLPSEQAVNPNTRVIEITNKKNLSLKITLTSDL